ncbi:unnamed protein product [Pedinophyceae sp. YPF-701]|nr:unnamed protein product [Pedinophyceae sp. YPF-701]
MDPESRLAAAAAKQDPARDRARREDAERQELLAGAAARRAPARPAVDDPADREAAIQQARRTHADTTASALRAQKIAEDTRETAVATNAALQQQRRVLEGAVGASGVRWACAGRRPHVRVDLDA